MKKSFNLLLSLMVVNFLMAQQPRLVVPIGLISGVEKISISKDQKKIITISNEQVAKLWEAQTGRLLVSLIGHSSFINSAIFSLDGKKIVTASSDNTAKIWNANTGDFLVTLKGHNGPILFAEFSQDGKRVVTASTDSTANLWDASSGKLLAKLKGHADRVVAAKFSPDDLFIVTASDDMIVKIWDVKSGSLVHNLPGHTDGLSSVQFSPDSKKLVTASNNNAKIWNLPSGQLLFDLKAAGIYYSDAKFSPDGQKIFTYSSNNNDVVIWDANSGNLLKKIRNHQGCITSLEFSQDGKNFVTTSCDKTAKIWDVSTGELLHDLMGHSKMVNTAIFIDKDKKILTTSIDETIKVWDAKTGGIIENWKGHTKYPGLAYYSNDSKYILTVSGSGGGGSVLWDAFTGQLVQASGNQLQTIFSPRQSAERTKYLNTEEKDIHCIGYVLDSKTNQLIATLKGHGNRIVYNDFSADSKKVVTASMDGTAKLWDAQTGQLLADLRGHTNAVQAANFSPDGRKIVTASEDHTVKIWDVYSGKLLNTLQLHKKNVYSANFSLDGKKIISNSEDKTAKIWDAETGKLLSDLIGHVEEVTTAIFSPNGKEVLTTSSDNTCKRWDSRTGKLLCTFFKIDSTDYFIQTKAGYYQCTQNAAKLLYYVSKDLKIITFEQLDVKYNRPDKVLEAIGNTDTALIRSYRKAYEKRIRKLAIDTTAFKEGYSVPEADFVNRDLIETEQKNEKFTLQIRSIDSSYKLDRFNIWVNEVPVYGQRGISIRNRNINEFDTIVTIRLSRGENRIETSVSNVNGTESYRIPLAVNYISAMRETETTRFVGIGIDKFADKKYDLEYSSKDIRDLSFKLKEKYGNEIVIDTLFNESVTVANVTALKKKLQQTTENDKVIIAYSGHGLLSKDYDYYLSTYGVNFEKPEQNGLPYDELENLLDSIPARKKLMLIDACHSGEVDKEEGIAMNKTADSIGLSKGVIIPGRQQQQHVGLKNSFELMQSLFVNVGKSTGATIISAAAGNQFALERGDLKNGVFTFSILEAMDKYPTIKISELKKIVGERVEQLTNGLQKPTSRNETIAVDWNVW